MIGWCFKCGRSTEASDGLCATCGAPMFRVFDGESAERAAARDSDEARVFLRRADLLMKSQRTAEARAVYAQAADAYLAAGFPLKAVAVYKQILKHAPDDAEIRPRLAVIYRFLGLTEEAEKLDST